jgi:hypothetical protein
MTEDAGKRVALLLGALVLIVAFIVGYIQNRQSQNYYTTPTGDSFFSDPNQTPEGESAGGYTILDSDQLMSRIGLNKFLSVQSKLEIYINQLNDKPVAIYYITDSFKLLEGGLASFKVFSVEPRYQFSVVFDVTNAYGEVSVE